MTLILTLGNRQQFIQLSDRRLSLNGKPLTDESDKAIYFVCANARFLIGFSGIAQTGTFRTHDWLIESLLACAKPDYNINEIHKRLQEKASLDFQTIPAIQSLPKGIKKLSIMFSGYLDDFDPPLGAFSILTNFQNFKTGLDEPEAWDNFETIYYNEPRPWIGEFSIIQRIGMWPAMQQSDFAMLRTFLEELKPAEAIIGKGVELFRCVADRPQAKGTIGKQISAICLTRNPNLHISTTYHTNVVSKNSFFPSEVWAVGDGDYHATKNAVLTAQSLSGDAVPVAFPITSRNTPCPCGSGKKYKFCHGAKVKKPRHKPHAN